MESDPIAMDQSHELHPFIKKHLDAALGYDRTADPDIITFTRNMELSCGGIPFLHHFKSICVVLKQTTEEKKKLGEICSGNCLRTSNGAVVLSLRWLLNNHKNVKVFSCTKRGCCCSTRSKASTRQILARGEDFECSDGFSLCEFDQ